MPPRTVPTLHANSEPSPGELPATPVDSQKSLLWDIFCQVIDNYGDVGVCWRLAAQLARRGHRVRLWLDDMRPLQWMAPWAAQGAWSGISVHNFPLALDSRAAPALTLADVWIEAFGCDIPPAWLEAQVNAASVQGKRPAWFNLEYLSAEPFALRSHGLPSPVMQGPAKGWTKYFFYPGFSPASGGLLPGVVAQAGPASWSEPALAAFAPKASEVRSVLLFAYANAPIATLLQALHCSAQSVQLLVAAGPSADAVRRALATLPGGPKGTESSGSGSGSGSGTGAGTGAGTGTGRGTGTDLSIALPDWRWGPLRVRFLPYLPQSSFDQLLSLCDLNLVRGEDSLAQAVQAGKPCVWQIYPQDDGAHLPKLEAYLDAIGADSAQRAWHAFWNGSPGAAQSAPDLPWPWEPNSNWPQNASAMATKLAQNTDLCSQLIKWAEQRGTQPSVAPA